MLTSLPARIPLPFTVLLQLGRDFRVLFGATEVTSATRRGLGSGTRSVQDDPGVVCTGGRGCPGAGARALGCSQPAPPAAREPGSSWRVPGPGGRRGRGRPRPRSPHPVFLQQGLAVALDGGALPGERAAAALVEGAAFQPGPPASTRLVLPPRGDQHRQLAASDTGRGRARAPEWGPCSCSGPRDKNLTKLPSGPAPGSGWTRLLVPRLQIGRQNRG